MSNTFSPHEYQATGIEFVKATPACALLISMGMGKTSIVLSAARDLILTGEVARVLVIAPKRVADKTWTDEAVKWAHTAGIGFARIMGTPKERAAALNAPAHIYLINRENVAWLVDQFPKVWPFDMIVIDESDSFKDPGSIRFRALRKVTRKASRVVILSGTPTPNSYLDLWSQFYLVNPKILGPSFTGYRETLFEADSRGRDRIYTYKLKGGSRELIEAMIAPVTLSVRAADYLKLPPQVDNVISVKLSKAARVKYDVLERDLVVKLAAGGEISAPNAAVLAGKLAQAANGAIYDEARDVHHVHDEKLDALEEILDTATSRTLIAYTYKHDLARIKARIPRIVGIDEPDALERWNRGEIDLACHPASAGHGLNLQDGGSNVVWFGLSWSSALTDQFNARLHRQGQTRPVVISYLCAEGTVDEDILAAVGNKHDAQEILLNALRRRVSGIYTKEVR